MSNTVLPDKQRPQLLRQEALELAVALGLDGAALVGQLVAAFERA